MSHDYRALKTAELADFSEFLHDLADAQWDRPSLCEGGAEVLRGRITTARATTEDRRVSR